MQRLFVARGFGRKTFLMLATTILSAAALPATAAIPTPVRPVSDPRALVSPVDTAAAAIPLDDLGFSRSVGSTAWGIDGNTIFLVTNITGRFNIWRTDARGSWPIQLTQSDDAQGDLATSPDGKTLFFAQDSGGNELHDIYAVPTAGGTVSNISATSDADEHDIIPAPGGRMLALSVKKKTEGQNNLAVMDLATRRIRLLTHEADASRQWSPVAFVNGDRAIIANRASVNGSEAEIWRVDVASGKAEQLAGKAGAVYLASAASADGGVIAATSNEGTGQDHAGVLAAGKWHWLAPTPWEQDAEGLSPDGKQMLVRDNVDGRSSLSLVDVATLATTPVALPPGVNSPGAGPAFSADGSHLLVRHTAANTPTELYVADLASGNVAPVTRLAMASLDPANLAGSKIVTYKSFDGTLVSAIVVMPFNLKRDGSNPAIVLPHGGPTGQSQDSFSATNAALASRGYVVIIPNFRGSTGYGQAFQKANFKDLGGGDLKDVLAAKDFLVASGYVDPKRVGIYGGSYGGFMTLMAIGKAPDAFAAAVQSYGIIDWRSMWEHEDALLQAYQRTLLGSPDENPKVYDAASPLTFIRAAKVPLLSLQGENDIRVPRNQAQQVNDVLKAKGNIVETIFYPAEGHGFRKRENQIDSLKRTVEWFERYLKPAGAK